MATRTVSNAGGNWSATGTWVGGVVPVSGDDVNFTATSGNLTVNVSTATLIGITFANYVGTITFNNPINTGGFVNLGTGGYTQAGTSGIAISGNTTLTSGGVTWTRTLNFASTSTITLVGNWTSTGDIQYNSGSIITINGNTLNVGANLTFASANFATGTTIINFNGTGTWSHTGTGALRNNVTINTAGTLTIGANIYYNTGTLTYTAGTVIVTGSTLNIGANTTLTTNGITWNNITLSGTSTITLGSNLTLTGTLNFSVNNIASFTLGGFNLITTNANITFGAFAQLNVPQNLTCINLTSNGGNTLTGNQISITGNLSTNTPSYAYSFQGTCNLIMSGTGTWTGAVSAPTSTSIVLNNLTFNTAGTITIGTAVQYGQGTLTYTAGTIVTTGSTLYLCNQNTATATLATNGMSWNSISFGNVSGATTIGLSNNFTCTNLTNSTQTQYTFNGVGINLIITGNLTITGTAIYTGTVNFIFNGTGTWSSGGGTLRNNTSINTAGTLTVSGNVYYGTGTLTYTAGTVVTTGSTLNIQEAATLAVAGVTWNTIAFIGTTSYTVTLSSNITTSNLNLAASNGTITLNNNTISVSGNLTISGSSSTFTGTSSILINGTGTWSHTSTGVLRNNTTINTVGTITVSGTVYYNTGTLTYTAGTVVTTGSTLIVNLGTTLATNGINWNNITFAGSTMTITLVNNLTITGVFGIGAGVTSTTLSFVLGGNNLITSSASLQTSGTVVFNVPQNLTFVNVLVSTGVGGCVFNSNQISATGNLNNGGGITSGSTLINLIGTGTWSNNTTIKNSVTINTVGTITISGVLFYDTGTLTYTAGTVVTTGSTLRMDQNTSLATNGITWNNIGMFGGATTVTLLNNLTVSGTLTISSSSAIFTGNTLNLNGSLTVNSSGGSSGTTSFIFGGTGTWTHGNTGPVRNNTTINTLGTITIGTNIYYDTGTLTYTAGTVVTAGSTLTIAAATTLITNGITWNNVTISGAANYAITLSNNLNMSGNFTLSVGGTSTTTLNGNTITVGGNLTNSGNGIITGTSAIVLNGTGTWSHSQINSHIQNNFTINTSGTITISGNVYYRTGIFTYTAGTVVTSGSTITISTNTTLNTGGIEWNNMVLGTIGGGGTFTTTLASNLTIVGTLTIGTSSVQTVVFTLGGNNLITDNGNLTITNSTTFTVPHNLTCVNLSLGPAATTNSNQISVRGNLVGPISSPATGTTSLVLSGEGTWSHPIGGAAIRHNLIIAASGTITLSSNIFYDTGTLTYVSGKVVSTGSTLTIGATSTLINCNKVNFNRVIITGGITLTMNEFFSGRPGRKATIQRSASTNYTVVFQDGFEKFASFINLSGATISSRNQLTVITNGGNLGNNIGVKFSPNQLVNGFPKNKPTINHQGVFSIGGLLSDPTLS